MIYHSLLSWTTFRFPWTVITFPIFIFSIFDFPFCTTTCECGYIFILYYRTWGSFWYLKLLDLALCSLTWGCFYLTCGRKPTSAAVVFLNIFTCYSISLQMYHHLQVKLPHAHAVIFILVSYFSNLVNISFLKLAIVLFLVSIFQTQSLWWSSLIFYLNWMVSPQ